MSIEICIINPYATAISNEKIKLCAQKILDKNSSIFISDKSFQEDYYDLHSETINVSKLLKEVLNLKILGVVNISTDSYNSRLNLKALLNNDNLIPTKNKFHCYLYKRFSLF